MNLFWILPTPTDSLVHSLFRAHAVLHGEIIVCSREELKYFIDSFSFILYYIVFMHPLQAYVYICRLQWIIGYGGMMIWMWIRYDGIFFSQ